MYRENGERIKDTVRSYSFRASNHHIPIDVLFDDSLIIKSM